MLDENAGKITRADHHAKSSIQSDTNEVKINIIEADTHLPHHNLGRAPLEQFCFDESDESHTIRQSDPNKNTARYSTIATQEARATPPAVFFPRTLQGFANKLRQDRFEKANNPSKDEVDQQQACH